MPRIARVEIVGYGHHVIQKGNRSQKVFFLMTGTRRRI